MVSCMCVFFFLQVFVFLKITLHSVLFLNHFSSVLYFNLFQVALYVIPPSLLMFIFLSLLRHHFFPSTIFSTFHLKLRHVIIRKSYIEELDGCGSPFTSIFFQALHFSVAFSICIQKLCLLSLDLPLDFNISIDN